MDRRTILAFVLIGLILILTQTEFYKSRVMPPQPITQSDTTAVAEHAVNPELVDNQQEKQRKEETPAFFNRQKEAAPEAVPAPLYESEELVQTAEKLSEIHIFGKEYKAVLTNRGGGLISWKLLSYLDADSQYVEMVPNVSHGVPTIGMLVDRDTVRYDNFLYQVIVENQVPSENVYLSEKSPSFTITYVLPFKDGRRIEKSYTFRAEDYNFDLKVRLVGFSNIPTDRSYQIWWDASLMPTEEPITDDLGYLKVYAYMGEDFQDFNIKESTTEWVTEEVSGVVNWTALRTKYFVSAVVPLQRKGRSIIYRGKGIELAPNVRFKYYNFAINMPVEISDDQVDPYTIYLGPLEYNELKHLGLGLDRMIMSSSGYERLFRPFSIAILVSFKFLQKFIPNWGLVIVVFSLLIKLLLYPLTHKSYTSMKKMQMIQPLMTELREKYKGDAQRLNKEMMKLYKEYGVNPMGGCLPMLLQMPLLIGLFIVFRSTIELRGAEFIWWITDLSKPDTIFTLPFALPLYGDKVNVLPIIMGLTMFWQQKSTMMQDPRQKMMAYFMPLFMTLLFNTFPSGLNLYYTLFNVLTILQQKLIKTGDVEIKPVEKKEPKRRKARK